MLWGKIIVVNKECEAVIWMLLDKHETQQEEDIRQSEHHVNWDQFHSEKLKSLLKSASNNSTN